MVALHVESRRPVDQIRQSAKRAANACIAIAVLTSTSRLHLNVMHLLYFWTRTNYLRDLDWGAGFHLNQTSKRLHAIERGESLWAFTRSASGAYVLAARLVCHARTMNPDDYRYGPYRVWGSLTASRYFSVERQDSVESLLRSLSPGPFAEKLGQSFQGSNAVKLLQEDDHERLLAHSQHLANEPRARLYPEEELEALHLYGDQQRVRQLLERDPAGVAAERARYLAEEVTYRNQSLAHQLRGIYEGRCQVCGYDPRGEFGVDVCEGHHMQWLSRGGMDRLHNMVLLCPNHHRLIHAVDAPFDFGQQAFVLEEGRTLPLSEVKHGLGSEE